MPLLSNLFTFLCTGSPFQFTVGQPAEGGPEKVRVSGRGLEYGEVNEMNEFSIYTHEAGAGGLSIAIEGPSKAEISFKVWLVSAFTSPKKVVFLFSFAIRKGQWYLSEIFLRLKKAPFLIILFQGSGDAFIFIYNHEHNLKPTVFVFWILASIQSGTEICRTILQI